MTLLRLSAAAAISAGALLGTHAALHAILFGTSPDLAAVATTPTWVALAIVELAGLAALLVALPGIYARQASRTPHLGAWAWILTTAGALLLGGFVYTNLFVVPAAATAAPGLLGDEPPASIAIGMLLAFVPLVLGLLLTGIAVLRGRVLPRGAGWLLVAGCLLNLAPVVGFLGIVVVNVAIAWLGAAMWRSPEGEREAAASAVAGPA